MDSFSGKLAVVTGGGSGMEPPTTMPCWLAWRRTPPTGRASGPMAGLAEIQMRRPEADVTVTGMQRADVTTTPEPFPAR